MSRNRLLSVFLVVSSMAQVPVTGQFFVETRLGFDQYEPPIPIMANGQTVLVYALHVTNFYP